MDTVKVLVEYGVKIDCKDESQQTPKDVAERFGHPDIVNFLQNDAAAISVEARKKYQRTTGLGDETTKMVLDPIVDVIQSTEEMNLERILKTAASVISKNDAPIAAISATSSHHQSNTSVAVSSAAKQRQRNLLFGVLMFTTTLLLGMAIGRRTTSSRPEDR